MNRRMREAPGGPVLADRVVDSGCRAIAILGLHPGSGAGTVLGRVAADLAMRGLGPSVTSAAPGPVRSDPTAWAGERATLPAGMVAATSRGAIAELGTGCRILEATGERATFGEVVIIEVIEDGPVLLNGPEDPAAVAAVLHRLGVLRPGPVLATGRWEQRAFAAPGTIDGVVLAIGAAASSTPERAASALRHHAEMFALPVADEFAQDALREASARRAVLLVGGDGEVADAIHPDLGDPAREIALAGADLARIVVPGALSDELLSALVRAPVVGSVVIHDVTRLNVSPVYYQAWLKKGGTFVVGRTSRLLAVACNPANPVGEDFEPEAFRAAVSSAVPHVPVHDVFAEAPAAPEAIGWRFWL